MTIEEINMNRVLVCGSRDYTNVSKIKQEMEKLPPGTIIIEGGALGADSIARQLAGTLNLQSIRFPAEWGKYGNRAGYIRNKQMLVEGKPTLVLAFFKDRHHSRGTTDMVRQARKEGIDTLEFEG